MRRRKRFLLWGVLAVIPILIGAYFVHQHWQNPTVVLVRQNLDWLVPVLVVVTMILLALDYSRATCPTCRKSYALKQTGRTEGGWWRGYRDEFKCKYCGHTEWGERPQYPGTGG